MTRLLIDNRWAVILGLIFAVLMQPLSPVINRWYQNSTPVVEMIGTVIERTDDSVLIHISGKKLRSCEFMRVTAFIATADGELKDAFLERIGGKPQDGATKPVGQHDLGLWRVWPLQNSTRASVFVQHGCNGELVLSRIADVDLTGGVK